MTVRKSVTQLSREIANRLAEDEGGEEGEEEEEQLEYDDGDSDFYEEGDSKRRRLE